MFNYSDKAPSTTERCYSCGDPATILLVSDTPDSDTGYVDEVALCDICEEEYGLLEEN